MAQKSSYTDIVHNIVGEAEETLDIKDIIEQLLAAEPDNPPKNPRATVRSALRSSGLIMPAGKSRFGWLPKQLTGARFRHTLTGADFESRRLVWDVDQVVAMWPAAEEPESRRTREPVNWETEGGLTFTLELSQEEEDGFFSEPDAGFWAWVSEQKLEPGDDLIITAENPLEHRYAIRLERRAQRNVGLIEERNRVIKRRTENYLTTQRDGVAKPRMIAAALISEGSYHDSVPPQSLSNLLPKEIVSRFGRAVPTDDLKQEKSSNVIPFPNKNGDSGESVRAEGEASGSVELDIPLNTGQELPDDRAYIQSMELLHDASGTSPALAIHMLGVSRLCSPAYAMLSQTAEYRKEALELAGQSVIAAERRIAHGVIESLVSGQEFALEDAVATYLESRSFLARALWHGGSFDEAIEQAMHCFEVDPEDPHVREDLFVMLFDSDRHEMVLTLLDSFPGASVTEQLYHRALSALLDDPESKDAVKALRKAVSHNSFLASLFLGEEPKKSKRSSMEEAAAYESAYGFLWRREDHIFDLLEEIVLAKR